MSKYKKEPGMSTPDLGGYASLDLIITSPATAVEP